MIYVDTKIFIFNGKPLNTRKKQVPTPASSDANDVVSNAGNLKSMWNSLLMMIAS